MRSRTTCLVFLLLTGACAGQPVDDADPSDNTEVGALKPDAQTFLSLGVFDATRSTTWVLHPLAAVTEGHAAALDIKMIPGADLAINIRAKAPVPSPPVAANGDFDKPPAMPATWSLPTMLIYTSTSSHPLTALPAPGEAPFGQLNAPDSANIGTSQGTVSPGGTFAITTVEKTDLATRVILRFTDAMVPSSAMLSIECTGGC
jgi:hypothetical protein